MWRLGNIERVILWEIFANKIIFVCLIRRWNLGTNDLCQITFTKADYIMDQEARYWNQEGFIYREGFLKSEGMVFAQDMVVTW